jgi:hypothetical protein
MQNVGGYWFLGLLDDDTNQKLATTYPLGTWSLQQYCPQGGREPYLIILRSSSSMFSVKGLFFLLFREALGENF